MLPLLDDSMADLAGTSSSRVAIRIEEVFFAYGARAVLESVDLSIPQGEIWGLVGRSGTGKTTLLHIVAGLFAPARGAIRILGRECLGVGRIKGIIFQEEGLLGWLSVEANVLFPNDRAPTEEARADAIKLLSAVGLGDRGASLPYELSTGMRKRLEFARALAADRDYLLADEPFGTLDALTRRDLWRLWRALQERAPRTGILSTHDPEEAVRLCDTVVTLRASQPSRISSILRVPTDIRRLDIGEHSVKCANLQERIIRSLEG